MSKVLIVIDAQNDFITGSLRNQEAIESLDTLHEVITYMEQHGASLIYTMDTHFGDYFETQEGEWLPVSHCRINTKGWELADLAKPADINTVTVIEKETFGYISWENYMPVKAIDEIVIVGYCSDICVISSALILKAIYPEIPITFISDASAGTTPEAHSAACTVMNSCQITVKSWKEYLEKK